MIISSDATRNAGVDGMVDTVDAASPTPGKLKIYTTGKGSLLVSIDLNDPAFGASSSGTAQLDVTGGLSGTGLANGTAAEAYITDGADVERFQLTAGTVGTEVILSTATISIGDTVSIISGSINLATGA